MNDRAVYRTAPATPGLSRNMLGIIKECPEIMSSVLVDIKDSLTLKDSNYLPKLITNKTYFAILGHTNSLLAVCKTLILFGGMSLFS